MKKYIKRNLISPNASSLIEVLVSLTILTVIIGPFLFMFLQLTNTTLMGENILEATYTAQNCMEEIYSLSMDRNNDNSTFTIFDLRNGLLTEGYMEEEGCLRKKVKEYYVTAQINDLGQSKLGVIIKVYEDLDNSKLKAQMEDIFIIGIQGGFHE